MLRLGWATLPLALTGLAVVLSPLGGCEPAANLEGKACPCVAGYVCCVGDNICLRPDQVCVGAGSWPVSTEPTTPQPLDKVTIYAFSQVNTDADGEGNVDDPQLEQLQPDMVLRGWAQWGIYGLRSRDYEFSYVDRCHARKIRLFMGGATATALLENEQAERTAVDYWDLTSRNAENQPLLRIEGKNRFYRGSLANPAFRERLLDIARLQIDGERSVAGDQLHAGVDGLHFQEVNGGYQGATEGVADGNEGFDKFHLADFNAYLLAKNPPDSDFAALYGMTADNLLRRDVLPGDLKKNFNYWTYLSRNGWAATPFADANPLAKEWGRATVNRPRPGALTFVDSAEPYRYWKQIAAKLRDYAWDQYRRRILITAQGIYPFVDFQSVGLSSDNADGPGGTPVRYLPLTADGGHLDGHQSLQAPFLHLKAMAEQFAPGAPVVLFLDGRWEAYDQLPAAEREDFWRLYAAEAYANGLFFAFHLKSLLGEEVFAPTATDLGLMDLFRNLVGFYRSHDDYYHGGQASAAAVTTSVPGTMTAVRDHLDPSDLATPVRRLVHLVNHAYLPGTGIIPQKEVAVDIASDRKPARVSLASPDLAAEVDPLSFSYADGQVEVTVPLLDAYAVIALWY